MTRTEKVRMLYGSNVKVVERDEYILVEKSKGEITLIYNKGKTIDLHMVSSVDKIDDNLAIFKCETLDATIIRLDTGKHLTFNNMKSINNIGDDIVVAYGNYLTIIDKFVNKVSHIENTGNTGIGYIKLDQMNVDGYGLTYVISILDRKNNNYTVFFNRDMGAVDFSFNTDWKINNYRGIM